MSGNDMQNNLLYRRLRRAKLAKRTPGASLNRGEQEQKHENTAALMRQNVQHLIPLTFKSITWLQNCEK